MLTEKIELLGKDYYANSKPEISGILTLKSIPTVTELDYVGAEDFDKTMINSIFPKSIEEQIPFGELLAIDFYWICRGLRMLSYGPYYTTNSIYCSSCNKVSYGEYTVDLRTVNCIPLPKDFNNDIVISKDEFLEFDKDLHISLLTINEQLAKESDTMFEDSQGNTNRTLASICYNIKKIGNKAVTSLDVKSTIENQMSAADYVILKDIVHDSLNFGLTSGGRTICPKCGSTDAAFMALIDDRFFRPTLGDLKQWKSDSNNGRSKENILRSKATTV